MGWGEYPNEYNPRVHGPYDPARWYGKRKLYFKLRCGVLLIVIVFNYSGHSLWTSQVGGTTGMDCKEG